MNEKAFFDAIRSSVFNGSIPSSSFTSIRAILAACDHFNVLDEEERAYILATVIAEVGRAMIPIREYGRGNGKKYGNPGRNNWQVPYGRGFVQITWDDNYERADHELAEVGIIQPGELIANYDLALQPNIAAAILVVGMRDGWFSGKGTDLSDYLGEREDWTGARYTVNVQDRAREIAGIAQKFDAAFEAAGYRAVPPTPTPQEPNAPLHPNPGPVEGPVEPPRVPDDPGRGSGVPPSGSPITPKRWWHRLFDFLRILARAIGRDTREDSRDP